MPVINFACTGEGLERVVRVPKRAFGFTAFGDPATNRIISLGLLAWNDYINEQKVLTCADTVPLQVGHWLYPHIADHPLNGVEGRPEKGEKTRFGQASDLARCKPRPSGGRRNRLGA